MSDGKQSLDQILAQWLESRPRWYSYALHVALQGNPTDADINALSDAACLEGGIDVGSAIEMTPLQPGDLASAGISSREVILESVTAQVGVNAIAAGSTLTFAGKGITVVYGTNGSGKSGFSRIIRNASTSRSGPAEILPNVFEGTATPEVSIRANIDSQDTEFTWSDDIVAYPSIPEVAYFDTACALKEVSGKDNAMLYSPKIIQALMRLSGLVTSVADTIQDRSDSITFDLNQFSAPAEIRNQAIVASALTCNDPEEANELISRATLSAEEESRLSSLPKIIASDPSAELPKYCRRLQQLTDMREKLVTLYKCCQPNFVDTYEKSKQAELEAEEASKAARRLVSNNSGLDGVGGNAWKALWEAARAYSDTIACPTASYPPKTPGMLCPLCQQPLDDKAIHRLDAFESYVKGVAEKNLTEKTRALNVITQQFISSVEAVKAQAASVSLLEAEGARSSMDELIQALQPLDSVASHEQMSAISNLIETAGVLVRAEIEELKKKAVAIEDSLKPGMVERLESEMLTLKGRAWVASEKTAITSDAGKRAQRRRLEEIKKQCNTRSVSQLVATVSQTEIVEQMEVAFNEELKRLRADDQRVSISMHTRSGQELQRIALDGSEESTPNVLSEGEQKIVALAGFFALLDVMPRNSTAVLDDPITSLDHLWRRAVARRIVEEAKTHPVIIFTHEPVFCSELTNISSQSDVQIEYRTISKRGKTTGIVTTGLDWEASNVNQRISSLYKDLDTLRAKSKAGEFRTDAELADELYRYYGKLRSTWERAVEAVLLAGVVERMQRPVHTQKLRLLTDIQDTDILTVDKNMSKCSELTEAHDNPLMASDALPTIDEFEADVKALKDWVSSINKRRNRK